MPLQIVENGRKGTILLCEEEPEVRNYLIMALQAHGYTVESADGAAEMIERLRRPDPSAAAVLLAMPQMDGLSMVSQIRRENQQVPLILLASLSSPVTPAQAKLSGATDFLYKPITHDALCASLNHHLGGAWTEPASSCDAGVSLFDVSRSVGWARRSEDFVRKVGPASIPVLILGETGTGKEVLARRLHARSSRHHKPFVKLNCAALPPELVESELFGYDRGAFTGAFQKKAGMFEQADGGTLLLDEIGDMDHKLQAKLLHVLQDRSFQHLGGKETVSVDVRVIAATHRNLEDAIAQGTFREDLYYRLNVISIHVPPLRQRRDEILPLAEHFLEKYRDSVAASSLTPALARALLDYDWPGNIRELENVMRGYIVMGDPDSLAFDLQHRTRRTAAETVAAAEVPALCASEGSGISILNQVNRAKELAELDAILAALNSTHWNRKQAAAILGIDYKALLYRMKKLNIDDAAKVSPAPVPQLTKPIKRDRSPLSKAASGFMAALAASALLPALFDGLSALVDGNNLSGLAELTSMILY